MLDRLTDAFVSGVNLLEEEGRLARMHVARTSTALLLCAALTVVGACGVLALLVGAAWYLAIAVGVPGALLIVGAVATIASAVAGRALYRRALD